jgi:diguanylate cyclase (GGDEF)-like protein
VGDVVLQTLSYICAEEFRTVDQIGRVGGEEFAVLFPELSIDGAVKACKRLATRIRGALIPAGGAEFSCTISIGITDAGREDDSVIAIMKRADVALYTAKRNGRDRVEVADVPSAAEKFAAGA